MAHHLGRAMLTSASPPHGSGKTPFGGGALSVGCHTGTISWTDLRRRLRRFHILLPGDFIYQFTVSSTQETASLRDLLLRSKDSRATLLVIHLYSIHLLLSDTRILILSAAIWDIHISPCKRIFKQFKR